LTTRGKRPLANCRSSAETGQRSAVETFAAFTPDNDPWKERDFGAFDHYDTTLTKGSEDGWAILGCFLDRVNRDEFDSLRCTSGFWDGRVRAFQVRHVASPAEK
jgi:hypothetical protein